MSLIDDADWSNQAYHWRAIYADALAIQLRQVISVTRYAPSSTWRSHLESCLTLLNATIGRLDLVPEWLELVERLHPWPVRWGQWAGWLAVLEQASQQADRIGAADRQAEYLAYSADLLLNVGRLTQALETAREAIRLARATGGIWALGVAGNAAAATLRAQARYDDAQTLVSDIHMELVRLRSPEQPGRAAMSKALLDLEQMDLLRHFKRLDDALALGKSLINDLAAAPDVDPHGLGHCYLRRATITWVAGQYQAAAEDLSRAAALFRQAGDPLQAVFAEGNLGLVYYSMSRYAEAEKLMLAAISAAEEVNARTRLVSDLGDLSVVYIALGQMERALDYSSRMVTLATELGNNAEISRARGNRGYALLGLGRYEEAWADIEFSLDLYRRQGRLEGTIITTVDVIMYLRGMGHEEEAARLARENHDRAKGEEFPHLRIVTGRCLALFAPSPEREALLYQALALAREHGRPMDEAGCLFSLAGISQKASERTKFYRQAAALLEKMGATTWLEGKSPNNPPLLPMTI